MTPRQPLVALIVVVAALLVAGSFAGVTYCYFYDAEIGGLNSLTAWTSSSWTTTTTAEFNAGVPVRVTTTGDEVKLNMTSGSASAQVYALGGGGTTAFWRYDVGTNTWSTLASTLSPVSAGGALIVDGGDTLFAFAGDGTRTFMMYYVSSNTWVSRANAPANIGPGGSLTYAGTMAYALAGGGTTTFMRYSPATNTWATMNSTPAPINGGAGLTWTGGDYIYALAGGSTTTFLRYTISTNTWVTMPPVPMAIGVGGSITYEGGSNLYAITGGGGQGGKDVYQYNISTMAWTSKPPKDTQNPVTDGAAVTWDGGPFLFVARGGGQNTFWKYTIATDNWDNAANTPGNVGPGGALSYVPGTGGVSCYSGPGSVASVVFDTGAADSRWDMLTWNASVPANTAITMEVRSSNTLFPMDDLATPWVPVTGTLSGTMYRVGFPDLPSGRYHQWRATLFSSACAATPVLYDATVYFSSGITPITLLSGLASMVMDLAPEAPVSRGITIANPPYDPYCPDCAGVPPAPEATVPPNATATPAPNGTINATPTATATPAPNANVNATPMPTLTALVDVTVNVTPTATPNTTPEAVQARAMYETPAPPVPYATATLLNATGTVGVGATVPPTPDITAAPYASPTAEVTSAPLVAATETPALPTAWEVAAGDRNLTTFVRLAREAGLDRLLDGTDPCTVFAPTDDAFRAMPQGSFDDLSADPDLLARTLNRHVVSGEIGEAELASMPLVVMLDGTEVAVTVEDGSTAVGNATVNYTDTRAANGVVFAVDAVIPPAETPIPTPAPLAPSASATPAVTVETIAPPLPVPSETVTVPVTPAVTVETTAPMPLETITVPGTTTVSARTTPPWAKSRPDEAG